MGNNMATHNFLDSLFWKFQYIPTYASDVLVTYLGTSDSNILNCKLHLPDGTRAILLLLKNLLLLINT